MTEEINQPFPNSYVKVEEATKISGFTMASDVLTCSLLRTLAATKRASRFLELGTGTGLSTSWILNGMDEFSSLLSIDNDSNLLNIPQKFLGNDRRVRLINSDAGEWVNSNRHQKFDYIFADTWHGKYLLLDEVLAMLNSGGLYIIDDMLPQPNWPVGHEEKAIDLVKRLDERDDLFLVKQAWATGIIVTVKR